MNQERGFGKHGLAWTALGLAAVTAIALLMLGHEPARFADNYAIAAKRSWLDVNFWASDRPFTVYLLYKLCGYDPQAVVIAQILLHAAAWPLLGWVVARRCRAGVWQLASLLIFALAGFSWRIAGWTHVLLSESLALSLFGLWTACLLRVWDRAQAHRGWWIALFLITPLFSFSRDHLMYFLPVVILPLALVAFRQREQRNDDRNWLAFAGWVLVILALQSWSANAGRRHVFPMINVVLQRILPDEDRTAWFEDRGAPLELLRDAPVDWRGEWASSHNFALLGEKRYAPFKAWVRGEAKSDYAWFLITHPVYTVGSAASEAGAWFKGDLSAYTGKDTVPALSPVAGWFWSPGRWLWLIPFVLAAALCWQRHRDFLPAALMLAALSNALIVFHADAMEVERHGLLIGVAMFTAGWLALLRLLPKDRTGESQSSALASSAMLV